ncbi:MAG: ABC transporter ATP-binding protein [candidate division WOR-3 bacterium]
MLDVKDLTKIYKSVSGQIVANDNITFSLDSGCIAGILGPNGAGKTTLIKQIATLLIPDKGDVVYKGVSLVKNPSFIRGRIGFLKEDTANVYHYLTGEANLYYFGLLNNVPLEILKKRVEELLRKMNLWEFRKDYVFNYSVGMKRKLAICTCLVNDPEIVILDEPWAGLDVIASEEVREAICELASNERKIIIITSHRMEYIERTVKEVFWIHKGKIVLSGTTHDLKKFAAQGKVLLFTVRARNAGLGRLPHRELIFEKLSDNIYKVEVNINHKELVYYVMNNYEVINIEEKEQDFEKIFKMLYRNNGE